jgi:[acyl-carrier-protein] S-malonyltransferase
MHRPVAILCSGQGGQHPGMFDLFTDCPACEPVFVAASEQLGQDPRRFVCDAGPADLFADRAGQILCCTKALAALGSTRHWAPEARGDRGL